MTTIKLFYSSRVSGATQFLGFSKLLRLASPNDAALGKLVTYCTGDQERIHEAIVNGVLLMGMSSATIMKLMTIVISLVKFIKAMIEVVYG